MRIDLHNHTALVSECSHIQPAEMVMAAIDAGLDGICITDHVFTGHSLKRNLSWPYAGYRAVKQAAKGSGLVVLPGIEFSFNGQDFLVFGLQGTALKALAESYSLQTCQILAGKVGGVVIQAHPYRYEKQPVPGMDVIEVCNGGNSAQENHLAHSWSCEFGVLGLAGSDAHRPEQMGRCYTVFDVYCPTVRDLCEAIRRRQVRELVGCNGRCPQVTFGKGFLSLES